MNLIRRLASPVLALMLAVAGAIAWQLPMIIHPPGAVLISTVGVASMAVGLVMLARDWRIPWSGAQMMITAAFATSFLYIALLTTATSRPTMIRIDLAGALAIAIVLALASSFAHRRTTRSLVTGAAPIVETIHPLKHPLAGIG